MTDLSDLARVYLPKYLTPKEARDLWVELEQYPDKIGSFYEPPDQQDARALQGDGWRGLVVVQFDTLKRRAIRGLIISNSCDFAPDNERYIPANVVFCPLLDLNRFAERLRAAGQEQRSIDQTLTAIRQQQVTSMFHLPEAAYGPEESVAFFDDIHTQPAASFFEAERTRLFRLSMKAFYVLLLKLSIHFCRFNERVPRLIIPADQGGN